MSRKFDVGEVVALLSGSCPMVITGVSDDGYLSLAWMTKNGELRAYVLDPITVGRVIVEPSDDVVVPTPVPTPEKPFTLSDVLALSRKD